MKKLVKTPNGDYIDYSSILFVEFVYLNVRQTDVFATTIIDSIKTNLRIYTGETERAKICVAKWIKENNQVIEQGTEDKVKE